jgi:hypothetical protein
VLDCKRIEVHSKFPNPNENTNMPYISKEKPQFGRENISPMLEKRAICEVKLLNWEAGFLNPIYLVLQKGEGERSCGKSEGIKWSHDVRAFQRT